MKRLWEKLTETLEFIWLGLCFLVMTTCSAHAQEVSGGRIEVVWTDSIPEQPQSTLGMTVCTPSNDPLTFLSMHLAETPLLVDEVQAHEARHRLQLAGDCRAKLKAILGDKLQMARTEIEASCAGYDAAGYGPDEYEGKLTRLLTAMFSLGAPAEDLVRWANEYCHRPPSTPTPRGTVMPGWSDA